MATREEIREVLITMCCKANSKDLSKSPTGFEGEADDAMLELQELGVVIKVDRELPKCPLQDKCAELSIRSAKGAFETVEQRHIARDNLDRVFSDIRDYKKAQQDMLEAGYAATEPLVEE